MEAEQESGSEENERKTANKQRVGFIQGCYTLEIKKKQN